MVLAVVLSAIVIIGYSVYQNNTLKKQAEYETQNQTSVQNQNGNENYIPTFDSTTAQNINFITNETVSETDSKEVTLENENVIAKFKNGELISYVLKKFSNTSAKADDGSNNVNLVGRVYEGIYPLHMSFMSLQNTLSKPNSNNFVFSKTDGKKVEFVGKAEVDNEIVNITKTFYLTDKPYEIKNEITFENTGEKDKSFFYSYFLGSSIGPYRDKKNSTREDIIRIEYLRNKKNTATKMLEGRAKQKIQYKTAGETAKWSTINNRYFAIIIDNKEPKTETDKGTNMVLEGAMLALPDVDEYINEYHIANLIETQTLKKDERKTVSYEIYMGPKLRSVFAKNYDMENYNGIFHESFIGLNLRPIIYFLDIALNKLYFITKNYALAILLFTLLFKIVTFPLTQAAYKSMKRMQLVSPKIERIRAQYKDEPEKMNQEIWKAYKKEKVSPMGGCLPTLLPFPFLIAFFYLMQSMVELRNASFLWITDLSSPDKLFVFSESLPLIGGFNFNLLPILMAITSYLSMKLQPSSSGGGAAANQMKIMSLIFPVMMLFMLYNFASGLALYWTAQNVLALVQQFGTQLFEKMKPHKEEEPVKETKKSKKKRK